MKYAVSHIVPWTGTVNAPNGADRGKGREPGTDA